MATRRLVKSRKYWRLWIFAGIITLGGLLDYLMAQGIGTGHSGDMFCGGDIECVGEFWINVPKSISNYLGEQVNITELCFGDKLEVVFDNPSKINDFGIYKADKRYSVSNSERWKRFNFTKNCLAVGNHSFKINGTKTEKDNVKWGISNTDIDPVWLGTDVYGKDIMFRDEFANITQWLNDSQQDWSAVGGILRTGLGYGTGRGCTLQGSNVTTKDAIDLSECSANATINWTQAEIGTLEVGDCLRFQTSNNNGTVWSALQLGFCDDSPKNANGYIIPQIDYTNRFKFRFVCQDFGQTGEGVNIPMFNITCNKINILVPNLTINFKNEYVNYSYFTNSSGERFVPNYLNYFNSTEGFGHNFNESEISNIYKNKNKTWDKKIYYNMSMSNDYDISSESYTLERIIPNNKSNEFGYITKIKIKFDDIFNKQNNLYNASGEAREISLIFTKQGRNWIVEFFNLFELDPEITQDTETNWSSWTNFKTNMTGIGSNANITLNWTYLSGGGCAECGNMSAGQKNYTLNGNASKVFDSGSATSKWDKIKWESELPNGTDIVGAACAGAVSGDCGIFLSNGSILTNLSLDGVGGRFFCGNINFNGPVRSYTLPTGISKDDIIGVEFDTDATADVFAFMKNGSVISDTSQADLTTDIAFTIFGLFTLPVGFNTSDVLGVGIDTADIDAGMVFRNGSYIQDPDSENPPFQFQNVRKWVLNSTTGLNSGNIIKFFYGDVFNPDDPCFLTNNITSNGYGIARDSIQDFTVDWDVDVTRLHSYNSTMVNITESTNITLRTAISNDSVTWSSSILHTYDNGSGFNTNSGAHIGRYAEVTAILTSPDKYITPSFENVTLNYTTPQAGDTCTCPTINTNWEIGDGSICVIDSGATCDIGTGVVRVNNGGLRNYGTLRAAGCFVANNQVWYVDNQAREYCGT